MKAVKISKIKLEIGDTIIELTLEEAKELRKILNDTFPEKHTPYQPPIVPYVPSCPRPYNPCYPTTFWTTTTMPDNSLKIICGGSK